MVRKRRKRPTIYDGINVTINENRKHRRQREYREHEYPVIRKHKTKETLDLNRKVGKRLHENTVITQELDFKVDYFNLSSSDIEFIERIANQLSISYPVAVNLVLRDALSLFKSNFFYTKEYYDKMSKENLLKISKE